MRTVATAAPDTLFVDCSTIDVATARRRAVNDYCPRPGSVRGAPSVKGYRAGLAGALVLKDLRLAMDAAQGAGAATPLGAQAAQVYGMMDLAGMTDLDFSTAIRFLAGRGRPEGAGRGGCRAGRFALDSAFGLCVVEESATTFRHELPAPRAPARHHQKENGK